MEPGLLEKILNFGGLGVGLIVAWLIARHYERKLDAVEVRQRADLKVLQDEISSWRERHLGKAENWAGHLAQLSAKSTENDLKQIALLEVLVKTRKRSANE